MMHSRLVFFEVGVGRRSEVLTPMSSTPSIHPFNFVLSSLEK